MSNPTQVNEDTPQGLAFAIGAYVLWGFLPLYLRLLGDVPAVEVLAHRMIWSVPVAGGVLIWLGRTASLRAAIRTPRMLGMAFVTATLMSLNGGIYIYAVTTGHAMDAALGYYMNPLFSIFLAAVFLGERLGRAQMVAIALALTAVLVLTFDAGGVPWLALAMMLTWGFYALAKKSLPIGPNQGFVLELLILMPLGVAYVIYLGLTGQTDFGSDISVSALLLGCGAVTAVPLMLYANGAKLLRLSTIGILQYIAPTMIFLFAVFLFGEEFGRARMIAFPMIWLALVIYTTASYRAMRAKRLSSMRL